ncbi:MAG: Thiamine-monophosphate kinase [Promethearchaeota archaeon CR_4]|nr:MAG: Thiamine-monophosphate kinase [Candidatus Lokiarchaeota archaeon CR_4]
MTKVPTSHFDAKATLGDVGQWDLLKIILQFTTPVSRSPLASMDDIMHLPIVTDTAGKQLFLKIDTFVQSTDMPPQMSHYQVGKKAVTAVISDLGAKGIRPAGIGASLCLPRGLLANNAVAIVHGIADACQHYDCGYFGGDLNEGLEIVITPVAVGMADAKKVPGRGGARPGDVLCVSDRLGRTAAGLEILLKGNDCPPNVREILKNAVFAPETPLEQGVAFVEHNFATAAIDSSDGIAFSIGQLATESKRGVEVAVDALPIAPEVAEYAPETVHQVELALYGGEEYCYLWTIPKNMLAPAKILCKEHKWQLFEIGTITQGSEIVLKDKRGESSPLRTSGFTHFAGDAPSS